jgi:hypothetical protein
VTVVETLLVFVGIPLAIVAVLALLTLRPEKGHRRLRYKPGQPWDYPPVWYEPHPESTGGSDGHGPAPAHGPAAVPGSSTAALGSSMYPEQPGERALDSQHGSGPMAAAGASTGSAAPRPIPGGPLGGARGTW